MPDILPLLEALAPALPITVRRQLSRIVPALLAMTGRITQLGLSRWTEAGGSYRTVHRFFHTPIDWRHVNALCLEFQHPGLTVVPPPSPPAQATGSADAEAANSEPDTSECAAASAPLSAAASAPLSAAASAPLSAAASAPLSAAASAPLSAAASAPLSAAASAPLSAAASAPLSATRERIAAGDETVITKAGKQTYGVDRFFSSLHDKPVPAIAVFSIALIDVKDRQAFSLSQEQVVRTPEEKEQTRRRKARRKSAAKGETPKPPKRPVGRPKGSKNKDKREVTLSPELQRIFLQAQETFAPLAPAERPRYFALDGHFGNHLACHMARQLDMHLISRMRANAELYCEPTPEEKAAHPRRKYGARLDYAHLPAEYCVHTTEEDGYRTEYYHARCLHKDYADPLNVVILVRTHLATQRVGHVILFTSDLTLPALTLVDYYSLRFQIEFTFRDAKQHFGLEDFMGVQQTAVTNAIGLAFFMGNLSRYLLADLRQTLPGAGLHDLKALFRAQRYLTEVLKCLPQKPDDISCRSLREAVSCLGSIHPPPKASQRPQKAA